MSAWQVKVITAPDRPDIPSQKIKIEIANIPSYTKEFAQISQNYSSSISTPVVVAVQSMNEIMADKLLAFPASVTHIRYRDIWDLNCLNWMSMNRVKPDIDLLSKKISDYRVNGFQNLLANRIDSLPSIINGTGFINQMSRFLRQETIENSLAKEDFRSALIGSIRRILSAAIDDDKPHKSIAYRP